MGFVDRTLARFGYSKAAPRKAAPQVRSFQAGVTDRLTASWSTTETTTNQDLYRSLKAMRARSRDFVRNNEYGKRFISLVKTNVVGPNGFQLKVDARQPDGKLDAKDSEVIARAFARWAAVGQCDVTGKLSFVDVQNLIASTVARDGEILVRKVKGRGVHRFQLQLLECHLLDEQHNKDLGNGHKIRMGVELDPFHKPVAYHVRLAAAADYVGYTASQNYERIPADECFHLFVPDSVDQWRGVPWAAPALRGARHLDQFEEAAIVAANIGAAKVGFFKTQDGLTDPLADDTDENGNFITDAEPGTFNVLPPGYDFQSFDPSYPHEMYDAVIKSLLRKMGSGLANGVAYNSLGNDLENVNYSSIRSGTIDEREGWKGLQGWLIHAFLTPMFGDWLAQALIYDPEAKALPFYKFDKFNAPVWQGRRWDWVDPSSDMSANDQAVALRIKSRAEIIRETGRDPEKVWAELEAEDERFPPAPAGDFQPGE